MTRTPQPNFLRAWREHRRLTQAQLASRVGTTGAVISLLESGARGLSDRWLFKLAEALETRPGHLLEMDPKEIPDDIMDIWAEIPPEQHDTVRRVMRSFISGRNPSSDKAQAS